LAHQASAAPEATQHAAPTVGERSASAMCMMRPFSNVKGEAYDDLFYCMSDNPAGENMLWAKIVPAQHKFDT
jgi:hypothetical protein